VFVGHRAFDRDQRDPLFPFGHGLGYTTWELLDMEVRPVIGAGQDRAVRVWLRNSGPRAGREVVQLYASRPDSAVDRPPRWLAGFAVAEAAGGEETTVEVALPRRSLAHWDPHTHAFAVEPGRFLIAAGHSSRDLRRSTEVSVGG